MRILQIVLIGIFCLFIVVPATFAIDPPCQQDDKRVECIFGKIEPPSPIAGLLDKDKTGAGAVSAFLSNLVALFYSLAVIVAIFMFLWAAFEWMASGGDKEKVASARNKIIYTIIGIILFAVAFAVIQLVGQFTGFTFFAGQNSNSCSGPLGLKYGECARK